MKPNKTALITGASRGIGKAIAWRLASEGYDLALHCRSRTDELKLAAELMENEFGTKTSLLQFDVADRVSTKISLEEYLSQFGPPYAVICNAGVTADNSFPAMLDPEWDVVLNTNLGSFYNVLHPLVMPMVSTRKPGRIVTISSVSGLIGNRGQVNYSASKAGIIGATKALAMELAKRNITVNCVAPGLIDTDMVTQEILDVALKAVPAQRVGRPEEVAATISFLLSEDASYITRQVICVNGGMF
ncbi:3-oxoacyl-ACP reductase FabG [Polynucleobacter sp. HIN8]|jgi:3-oxoacyl-[acyl-carrier protein] reductase|uniref:3-oxoacyl-ACP reductase FabG n=1 Tax=Polynucleobacter sp. HIN8 TaxID=3047867 RepID=UPI002573C98A|nr:3-oxoacyl-ACP reductase FabG [Polynucleobacter sp. HIN8]BEI38905.1 3-oxoacyl-ACP reductase FabG [Polynucleobacter sp. HIN8]